jgi:gas vesicle protein
MSYDNGSMGKGLAMLGGIAAGAALMYLFDPEEGNARRQHLTESANDALSKAGTSLGALGSAAAASLHHGSDSAGSTLSSLAEKARELAATIAERAQSATSGASSAAESGYGSARDTASSWVDRASASARGAYDRAASSAGNLYDDARRQTGLEEERSSYVAPVAIGAGTAALLGAAAVYFLDSEKGPARRQQAYDLANSVVVSTRDLAHQLADKVKGQPAQMDYATSDDYIDESPEVGRDVSGQANAI